MTSRVNLACLSDWLYVRPVNLETIKARALGFQIFILYSLSAREFKFDIQILMVPMSVGPTLTPTNRKNLWL